jgi:two-component system, OmpR family, sensor kinase
LSRLPIRVRLTAAFALAMLLVLAGAGLFVYLRLRADLNDSVNAGLRARADTAAARQAGPHPAGARGAELDDPEESFVQVLTPSGRIVDRAGHARIPALRPAETRRARHGTVLVERSLPGIDGRARVLGRQASAQAGPVVVVVGQSLNDRNEALSGVVDSFAVGGGVAILLASGIGYLLASAGMAPVEAMRRRAREVSLTRAGERLPLPDARDEVRRLGETLNEMLDRLQRSFERERRFVADASHELRTPVAVVKTELEGALQTGDYGPEVRESLVAAVEECDRLAQLAEDLLVIARSAEGELPVRREALQVRSVLEGVRDRFVDRAERHGRRIRIDADGDRQLSADPLRVRQALGNLVDNALRYGDGEIVVGSRAASAGVQLEVSDGGPGFAPEIAGQAFERFARGDQARGGDGTGLGLAIVRAVAEAHGGSVAIVPGRGATVRMWLPDGDSQAGLSRTT